jgi:hypothetical protein
MRIEPQYVTFEQAKLLKEKGFDELTSYYFLEESNKVTLKTNWNYTCNSRLIEEATSAPEQYQVVEWLDKTRNTYIHVQKHTRNGLRCYSPFIDNEAVKKDAFFNDFDSQQEAYSAAINYILKELI